MNSRRPLGFALVLTLALLSFMVLLLVAFATLGRISSQVSSSSLVQLQARQNALLGLRVGLGELQRYASADTAVTGMGGVGGAATGTRYRLWTGVWDGVSGQFLAWLSSGAGATTAPGISTGTAITLVGGASVGTTTGTDVEQVDVGRVRIAAIPNDSSVEVETGGYAYWVGDEGVKISAYPQPGFSQGIAVDIGPLFPSAKQPLASTLPNLLTTEQFQFLAGGTNTLSATQRYPLFHSLTVNHIRLSPTPETPRQDGCINVNTTSETVWAAVIRTYNSAKASSDPAVANVTSASRAFRDGIASLSSAGKPAYGPFPSTEAFADSGILATALGAQPAAKFMGVVGGLLTARSDTFKIRAYGDAVDPIDPTKIVGTALCEAVVQRKDFPLPVGRKFVVIYFRWLLQDDI